MKRLKRTALKQNVEIQEAINSIILPFSEITSLPSFKEDNVDRINAHDLFSFYTADIIKEDVVFSR